MHTIRPAQPMKPEFRNVDLEVISRTDPTALTKALGNQVDVLWSGPPSGIRWGKRAGYFVGFEVRSARPGFESMLNRFCELIETLPPAVARIWKRARRRTLDIGLESGEQSPPLALRIEPETLARIVAIGATIAITLYPSAPNYRAKGASPSQPGATPQVTKRNRNKV